MALFHVHLIFPINFTQYTGYYSNVVTTAYILFPNKKRPIINVFFGINATLHPQLNPKSMTFDFEKSAMNVEKSAFPSIDIKGCFFISVSIWRHISPTDYRPNIQMIKYNSMMGTCVL